MKLKFGCGMKLKFDCGMELEFGCRIKGWGASHDDARAVVVELHAADQVLQRQKVLAVGGGD